MKIYKKIILKHHNNFIGRFVEHYLENNAVADREDLIYEDSLPEDEIADLLVIANPHCLASSVEKNLAENRAKRVVLLSSTDIYVSKQGENLNELAETDSTSEIFKTESAATEFCRQNNIGLTILRLPELVVGTGMGGMLIRMVEQINRGTYLHIKDCSARRSVIHASSIGPAVAESVEGIFNIADAEAPEVSELAEAISFRIGQKRIYSTKLATARKLAKIAPLLGMGGWKEDMLKFKTESLTFSTAKAESSFGFRTEPAVYYLRNHQYDENSL